MTEQEQRMMRMMAMDGPTVDLVFTNTYGDEVNAGGRTISAEAFHALGDEMLTWVGTRIQQRMNANGKAAKVKVTVTVEFPE